MTRRKDLSATAKLCLGAIRWYCYKSPTCWPAHGTIADMIGCSESAVKNCLRELIAAGLVIARPRWTPTGKQQSNTYELAAPGGQNLPASGGQNLPTETIESLEETEKQPFQWTNKQVLRSWAERRDQHTEPQIMAPAK